MKLIKKILMIVLKAVGIHVSEDNIIKENDFLLSKPIECNGKPMLLDYNSKISNFKNYILLKIDSAAISCTYHILDKYITITLSSKVKLVADKLIKFVYTPELHSKAKSERLNGLLASAYLEDGFDIEDIINETLSQKFLMLNKLIRDNNVRDSFIKLSLKFDYMIIKDSDNNISNDSYIDITFPLYELLQNRKSNKILSIVFTEKEIKTLRSIYQYIFENIDEKHGYRLNEYPLFKESKDDKQVYKNIYGDHKQDTIKLIKAFVNISKEINKTLDDLSFMSNPEDEKFELDNIEELIGSLETKPLLLPYVDFEGTNDVIKEKKRDKACELHALNKTLNEKQIENESISVADTEYTSTKKRTTYKKGARRNRNVTFISSVNLPSKNTSTNSLVLDPTDDSFDKLISNEIWNSHKLLNASSGKGKSEATKVMALKDIQDKKSSFVLIDGGEKLAPEFAKNIQDSSRLVYLDESLNQKYFYSVNPLDSRDRSEKTLSIKSKHIANSFELLLEDDWSSNMLAVLIPVLYVLMEHGGFDIYDLKKFMDEAYYDELKELAFNSKHEEHRDFILNDLNRIKSIKSTRDAIFMKLQNLGSDDSLKRCIKGQSTLDLEELINTPGTIIIIKPESIAFGILLVAMIQGIVEARDVHKCIHTNLYIDEFADFVSPSSTKILSKQRKKGLHLTMIHQELDQIKDIKSSVFANTNIKIVGKNSYENLKVMSKEIQVDVKELEKLGIGEFYIKIGTKEAVKIKVTDKFIDQKGAMGDTQWKECIANQLKLYYESSDTSDKDLTPTVIAQKSESITQEFDLKKQLKKEFTLASDSSTTTDDISDDF